MRKVDREITSPEGFTEILESCKVCRVAFADGDDIYIVPLNFGYTQEDGKLTLYFHSAREGRKIDLLSHGAVRVSFEMDCAHELVVAAQPCGYGYHYKSMIGRGLATLITDVERKAFALNRLMLHQMGEAFDFDARMTMAVSVFKVVVDSYTGKQHQ